MPRAGWWAWPSPSRPTARGWPTRSTSWSWKRCWPPTSTPRPTPAPASAEGLLLEAVGDATALEVVGGDLDLDPITGEDPDAVLAHLPTQVPEHLVASIDRDPEVATLEGLFGGTFEQERIRSEERRVGKECDRTV